MNTTTLAFTQLHQQQKPLIIANVWDVGSARIAENLGFQAIGTSSAAIAANLGYDDGEDLNFDELLYVVGRIKACTNIPLSVDLEAGYSLDVRQIIKHTQQLMQLNVAGINLEDSLCNPDRKLVEVESFAEILHQIKIACGETLFINARCDAFLMGLPNALDETLHRIACYEKSGIDGIFVPCAVDLLAIKTLCQATHLPINIMCMPELANFNALSAIGVHRISMGNFVHNQTQKHLSDTLQVIMQQQSFGCLFKA